MKVLIVNTLHPNGGSETYIFEVGEATSEDGHQVEYFEWSMKAGSFRTGFIAIQGIWIFIPENFKNYGIRSRFSLRQRLQKRSGKCWTTFSRTWFMSIISISS